MINLLIADDHSVVRDGLRALLEANPEIHVVGDAADGAQAVSQAQAMQPDVVIMDITMPVLDGVEATRQILELLPAARVIILSMVGDTGLLVRSLKAGARGYLLKESAGREVAEAVLAVYAGNVYLSQQILRILIADYLECKARMGAQSPLEMLSQREREVLKLVVDGKSSAEIAKMLFLSPKTVESYRSRLMHKLEVPDLPSLIRYVLEHGLLR